jgi:hypothetical protein
MGSQMDRRPATGRRGPSRTDNCTGQVALTTGRHSLTKNLYPPFSGGAGRLAAVPTPNSLTRYAAPWNALGTAYETRYADLLWREFGANVQLRGVIVMSGDS